jgi:SH3-like domain-containing protein
MTWKIYQVDHVREGVIIEQKVDVHSGPGTENITVVTVHEGILVRIRGESNGWFQISLPNGWNGWLPSSAIRIL